MWDRGRVECGVFPFFERFNFQILHILTSNCASRHGRALFHHLNFKKRSGTGVLSPYWLPNVLRASHLKSAHFFHISTSKCGPNMWCFYHVDFETCFVPRFFMSHLTRWLCTPRFSEPTSWPTKHWKNRVLRDFDTFEHLHLLSSDSFYSLIFFFLLFFFDSSRLGFSICPYCRKFEF